MSKYKVLVVEDEFIVSKDIQNSLIKLGYNVIGSAATGEKAIELALAYEPDVILMDIMLKGELSGIQAAEKILENKSIPIIFLTAYADESTLSKAKMVQPFGYIIKPFKDIDLHTTIEMAIFKHGKDQELLKERNFLYNLVENKDLTGNQNTVEHIFVKSNSKLVRLIKSEILFIEALKDYVNIHTENGKFTVHSTMKDIEAKLGNEDFVRVHRSFIVRMDKISSIDYPTLILGKDKKTIPIGGSYRDELSNRINLF